MNQRVVAVFEDRAEAEDARRDLLDAGFSESQIDIKAQSAEETSALGQYVEEERRTSGSGSGSRNSSAWMKAGIMKRPRAGG
jgi:hypothetical protein